MRRDFIQMAKISQGNSVFFWMHDCSHKTQNDLEILFGFGAFWSATNSVDVGIRLRQRTTEECKPPQGFFLEMKFGGWYFGITA